MFQNRQNNICIFLNISSILNIFGIFILERSLDKESVLFISNLSKMAKSINHGLDGNFENLLNGELIKLSSKQNLEFNSWDYLLLKKIDIK